MIKRIRTSDLKIGMFVAQVHSSWLNAPLVMKNFRIDGQKDINHLLDYDIEFVSIDTEKSVAPPQPPAPLEVELPPLGFEDTFEAPLAQFWVNRSVPVDFYYRHGGKMELILRKGLVFSVEVDELFRGRGVAAVRIPNGQKRLYDEYLRDLESLTGRRREMGYDGAYVNPEAVRRYHDFMEQYYPISAHLLAPDTTTPFDIFMAVNKTIENALGKGGLIGGEMKEEWIAKDHNLVIRKEDKPAYQAYMMANSRNSKDTLTRHAFVVENSKLIVEGLAENPRSEKLMNHTKEAVTGLTRMVVENPATFYSLIKINNYDYYTFTHSVNVATLSLAMAMASGINDQQDLSELGLGCILHDLGKARVETRLINKPGKLTDTEFKEVKNHVLLGYEMVKDNPLITKRSFYPILQHHEKLSGSGYPSGLQGDQIHAFGRIASIIDIYDALTTERAYKKAFKPYDALALIFKGVEDYDRNLITTFVRLLREQSV